MNGSSVGLTCRELVIDRAGSRIIRDVSLVARSGDVTVILGANGAGKTTLLEGLSGLIPVLSGRVSIGRRDVTRLTAARRARAGLSHIEQGRPVFGELTVEENLLVAASRQGGGSAFEMFPELEPLRDRPAALLSGGQQQMLVIARAILRQPRIVLLDEISLGLAPALVARLLPRVRALADAGMAVVLVEQFANLALSLGNRAYVLAKGTVVFEGACTDLMGNPGVLKSAYLRVDEGAE
jgi:branched-chain amino acid transport system ATP-binding protein